MSLSNRFPNLAEIASVYAVGVVILYTSALMTSLKDFSSNWVLYLSIADILSLFAYIIVGAFLESLLLIAVLLFIAFFVPPAIRADRFVLYGVVLTAAFLAFLALREVGAFVNTSAIFSNSKTAALWTTISAFSFLALGERIPILRKWLELAADRCVVFLYIYLPLSFISMIVALFRNLN